MPITASRSFFEIRWLVFIVSFRSFQRLCILVPPRGRFAGRYGAAILPCVLGAGACRNTVEHHGAAILWCCSAAVVQYPAGICPARHLPGRGIYPAEAFAQQRHLPSSAARFRPSYNETLFCFVNSVTLFCGAVKHRFSRPCQKILLGAHVAQRILF